MHAYLRLYFVSVNNLRSTGTSRLPYTHLFVDNPYNSDHWWLSRRVSTTHWLLVTNLHWDHEPVHGGDDGQVVNKDHLLLHGHHVHRGEVLLDSFLAAVPLIKAKVLLKVDDILSHHDGVHHVCLHPVQPLHALVTGVSSMNES